jgi:hypothetical protein
MKNEDTDYGVTAESELKALKLNKALLEENKKLTEKIVALEERIAGACHNSYAHKISIEQAQRVINAFYTIKREVKEIFDIPDQCYHDD